MSAAQTMAALAQSARETERTERERLESEPFFVTAMPSSSVASASAPAEADASCPPSAVAVEGRVFRRLQRFQLLRSEIKAQSDMVATYLLAPKVRQRVFEQRKHWWQRPVHLAKAGLGTFVQGRKLLKSILGYLVLSHAANNSLLDAQQLAEGLVLSGFLSPVHEAPEANDEPIGEIFIEDDAYYELVAPGANAVVPTPNALASATINNRSTSSLRGAIVQLVDPPESPTDPKESRQPGSALSVWAVTDGATRAGFVLRRFGQSHMRTLLGFASKARRCYAVVNKTKHHSLVLFETDVARRELVRVALSSATVEYYSSSGDDTPGYALKICGGGSDGRRDGSNNENHDTVEILVLRSKPEQEQWLLALRDAGAAFLETHPGILSCAASSASLYSLRDTDASGKTFWMSDLRGHVALLTNVPSDSGANNVEQFTELVELVAKYESGLKVVAFPSAQFGDAEFSNDEELGAYLQQTFGVSFPVLATRDVNGPNAREALLFCKTQLTGGTESAANSFIEDNFVKFLVGRDGRPVKRYGPYAMPSSLETDIQRLLKANPTPTL
ncbi:hypothetical protein PRIC1_005196 [Phytophthora ramorum]